MIKHREMMEHREMMKHRKMIKHRELIKQREQVASDLVLEAIEVTMSRMKVLFFPTQKLTAGTT